MEKKTLGGGCYLSLKLTIFYHQFDGGGQIVGEGTPEDISEMEESHTGRFLKDVL